MEKTPLELYETAYRLHYSEHRIPEAVTYYQRLIKEFPDSNECGYSVIQLQKIKATEVAADLATVTLSKQPTNRIILPLFILLAAAMATNVYLYHHFTNRLKNEEKRISLAFNALSKISRGNHEDALIMLHDLKVLKKDDIMPYELCADIYRKDDKYDLAKNEYVTFFQVNTTAKPTENEKWFMELGDPKRNKVKSVVAKPAPQPEETSAVSQPVVKKPPVPRTKTKKTELRQPPPPAKSGNGLFLVDPDSISYF